MEWSNPERQTKNAVATQRKTKQIIGRRKHIEQKAKADEKRPTEQETSNETTWKKKKEAKDNATSLRSNKANKKTAQYPSQDDLKTKRKGKIMKQGQTKKKGTGRVKGSRKQAAHENSETVPRRRRKRGRKRGREKENDERKKKKKLKRRRNRERSIDDETEDIGLEGAPRCPGCC